ncbi:hypothetical protein BaRGS_00010528 [Batillaria attramentaria]|uniref:Uncharacterized protein n=1 Tax=Batillaria attramentaria TaxID=370345 RepID=A0ABD0LGA4_9CAEN
MEFQLRLSQYGVICAGNDHLHYRLFSHESDKPAQRNDFIERKGGGVSLPLTVAWWYQAVGCFELSLPAVMDKQSLGWVGRGEEGLQPNGGLNDKFWVD